MTDVFISYAREDQPFVRQLSVALDARGRAAWVDWEGIPPTAEWLAEIREAIAAAHTFVFVISPDALASKVCALEVEQAVQLNKRLVPLVRREADGQPVPDALAKLNWIFLREGDDFDAGVDTLTQALDSDLEHLKLHTHYLLRALDWERKAQDASLALRGRDLAAAEGWLAHSGDKAPQPTSLHNRHILDSRRVATRRQRLAGGAIAAGVLVATVLGLLAWQQSVARQQNQQRAIANQLVGESRLALDERDDGLVDSVQFAAEAMRRLAALGERSLAVDQALRRGLALLPPLPAVAELSLRGETVAAAFGPTGGHLAVASRVGDVVVHDLAAGRTVGAWTMALDPGDTLRAVAVDASGTRVAVWRYRSAIGRSRLSLWQVADGTESGGCDVDGDTRGAGALLGPLGRLWVDRSVWRLDGCRDGSVWGAGSIIAAPTLSADGRRLAASVRQRGERQRWIELRDAAHGDLRARWQHDDALARLWFIDDDRRLAGVDRLGRRWWIWSVATPGAPRTQRFDEPVRAVRPDGAAVVTATTDSAIARIRDVDTGAELHRLVHAAPFRAVAFSPDGDTLSTLVGHKVWHWPLTDGGPAGPLLPDPTEARQAALSAAQTLGLGDRQLLAAAPCPDAGRIAVSAGSITRGGWQAQTEVWAVAGRQRLASFDLTETVGAGMRGIDDAAIGLLACSADGRRVATPARDAAVVRDVASGALVARLPHPGLRTVVFTPDGRHAATAGRGPVRVWQLETRAEVARLLDDTPVQRLAFSDDGRFLLTAGEGGARRNVWRPKDLIDAACARLRSPLPVQTWQRLFPDVGYEPTCPASADGPPGTTPRKTP